MNVVSASMQNLNPSQTPVIACDQPLFAKIKLVKWSWPQTHGEDRYFVEIAALRTLGDWLDNSGLTHAIEKADVASSRTAESLLKASEYPELAMFTKSPQGFTLNKNSFIILAPWFFALDHHNYAPWLPVHIRDLFILKNNIPKLLSISAMEHL
ncbi:hypothetical protein MAR_019428 [Mya arenaria]|uniref:Uncharacterized protein n=1 Tax=Mya arenaria TaxID=6604 RepID=A0ABY7EHJ9_MYAAR|nr:hypothetical protein MAR_019428 [Mya arenaria]